LGVICTGTGRVRLGIRILFFLSLAILAFVLLSLLVPSELPYATLPILLGSLVAGWIVLRLDGRGPGALGFYLAPEAGREALLGLGLGVLVSGAVVASMVAVGALRWNLSSGEGVEYLEGAASSLWLLGFPAAGEEALMRGYLFQAFAEAWGGMWGVWITSLLFGALHLGNPDPSWMALGNIVLAGVFLGVVYLKTASLWWVTGVHLGWNWTHGFLADLPVSGLELMDAPALEPVIRGPAWLSGGGFGPEGSVLATVVLAVASVAAWNTPWLRPGKRAREVRPLWMSEGGEGPPSPQSGPGSSVTWEE